MTSTELPAFVAELEEIKNRTENEDSKPVKFAMQAAFEHEICKHGPALLALIRRLQWERDRAVKAVNVVCEILKEGHDNETTGNLIWREFKALGLHHD